MSVNPSVKIEVIHDDGRTANYYGSRVPRIGETIHITHNGGRGLSASYRPLLGGIVYAVHTDIEIRPEYAPHLALGEIYTVHVRGDVYFTENGDPMPPNQETQQ